MWFFSLYFRIYHACASPVIVSSEAAAILSHFWLSKAYENMAAKLSGMPAFVNDKNNPVAESANG